MNTGTKRYSAFNESIKRHHGCHCKLQTDGTFLISLLSKILIALFLYLSTLSDILHNIYYYIDRL